MKKEYHIVGDEELFRRQTGPNSGGQMLHIGKTCVLADWVKWMLTNGSSFETNLPVKFGRAIVQG